MSERARARAAGAAEVATTPAPEATAEIGPGLKRLQELVAAGEPDPKAVVDLIDAHRGERAAMVAYLHQALGNAYVARVDEAMDRVRFHADVRGRRAEVVAGDPAAAEGGYFIASTEERGARWRTGGGGFSGRLDARGLDATLRTGEDTSLHATVDARERSGVLGLRHEGETVGELAGRYRGADDWRLGLRRPIDLGGGATLTPEARHEVGAEGARELGVLGYRDARTSGEVYAGVGDGHLVAGGSVTRDLGRGLSLGGQVDHDRDGVTGGVTLSGSHSPMEGLTLSGSLSHGTAGPRLTLGEEYRSPTLMHSASLEATPESLRASGSLDTRLAPHLYAGMFGGMSAAAGADPTLELGGSLTFQPHERAALTVAGIIDQNGAFETRLQLDVFKKKVEGLAAISEAKKKALVSLFVSYTSAGGTPGMLDGRMGDATFSRSSDGGGSGTITGGIRISF